MLLFLHFFIPTKDCIAKFEAEYTKMCADDECWWHKNTGWSAVSSEPHEHFEVTSSSVGSHGDCYEVFTTTVTAAHIEPMAVTKSTIAIVDPESVFKRYGYEVVTSTSLERLPTFTIPLAPAGGERP